MTKNTEMKRFGVILFAALFAGLLTVSYGEATAPGQETTGPVPETARVTPGEQQEASISSGYDGGGDDLRLVWKSPSILDYGVQ